MAEALVPDELWEAIAPLLPRHKARPGQRGRPPVDDRACLTGIVFVLQSGIPWWMLPQEMGCGSGVTCWRRLRHWQRRGVWKKLLHAVLDRLGREGLKRRRIEDHLARQRAPHGSGLGKIRWVVERTLAWIGQARRLKIRYDKLPSIHRAFHYLQLARICCKVLQRDF